MTRVECENRRCPALAIREYPSFVYIKGGHDNRQCQFCQNPFRLPKGDGKGGKSGIGKGKGGGKAGKGKSYSKGAQQGYAFPDPPYGGAPLYGSFKGKYGKGSKGAPFGRKGKGGGAEAVHDDIPATNVRPRRWATPKVKSSYADDDAAEQHKAQLLQVLKSQLSPDVLEQVAAANFNPEVQQADQSYVDYSRAQGELRRWTFELSQQQDKKNKLAELIDKCSARVDELQGEV